jgi:hypothetical protein
MTPELVSFLPETPWNATVSTRKFTEYPRIHQETHGTTRIVRYVLKIKLQSATTFPALGFFQDFSGFLILTIGFFSYKKSIHENAPCIEIFLGFFRIFNPHDRIF